MPGARNIIQAAADSVEDTAPIETTPPVEVEEEAAPTVETVEEDSEVETGPGTIPLKAPTQEWLGAQENLRDVGAYAQERRHAAQRRREASPSHYDYGQLMGFDSSPRRQFPDPEFVTDPEVRQMTEFHDILPGLAWGEDVRRYEAEQALRKVKPTESAIQLSGVGPGTESQLAVKASDPSHRVSAPGAKAERGVESWSEPWWSPLHLDAQQRPEGTSWFVPPEPDRKGFDKAKAREKLLAPAEDEISGKMHFGHSDTTAPPAGYQRAPVFSEGNISLPRLNAYYAALLAEREAQSQRASINWQSAKEGRHVDDALVAMQELRRIDADLKRVKDLDKALKSIARKAGISGEDIRAAIDDTAWQGPLQSSGD